MQPKSGGKPFNGLALLDGSGFQVTDEDQNSDDPEDWFVENEFKVLPTADFDDLELGDWWTYYTDLGDINEDDSGDGDPPPDDDPPPDP